MNVGPTVYEQRRSVELSLSIERFALLSIELDAVSGVRALPFPCPHCGDVPVSKPLCQFCNPVKGDRHA